MQQTSFEVQRMFDHGLVSISSSRKRSEHINLHRLNTGLRKAKLFHIQFHVHFQTPPNVLKN